MFPFSLEAPLEASTELYTLLLAAPAGEIQIDAQRAGLLRLYLPAKLQETAVALHTGCRGTEAFVCSTSLAVKFVIPGQPYIVDEHLHEYTQLVSHFKLF